jgi:hypothetical protein
MSHSPYGPAAPEYAAAFDSVRIAKSLCLLAILLALTFEGAAFILVRFGGKLDAIEIRDEATVTETPDARGDEALAEAPVEAPAEATSQPATTNPAAALDPTAEVVRLADADRPAVDRADEVGRAVVWKSVLAWFLHATKLLTPLFALLLVLVLALAVNFSLLGRLGGAAGLTSALLWSLILLLLVCPWQLVLRGGLACGAMYDMSELIAHTRRVLPAWGAQDVRLEIPAVYYVRFAGLPLVALIVWLAVLLKFSRGRRQMAFPVGVTSIPPMPAPPAPRAYTGIDETESTP